MLISKEHEQCKYQFYSELDRLSIERGEKDFNYRNYVYFDYRQLPVISGEHLFIEEVYQRIFFGPKEPQVQQKAIQTGMYNKLIEEGQELIRIGELLIAYGQKENENILFNEPVQAALNIDPPVIATALQLMKIQRLNRVKPDRKNLGFEHSAA